MSPTQTRPEINRQNAQQSTGPVTIEGKQRSSLNATRHGFTGQTLILSPTETEAYQAHVKAFFEESSPAGHLETNLVQQLADAHWSLQQIFVQQANIISLLNAIAAQLAPSGDALATANALAPHIRSLSTLNLYEQRRRRVASAIEEQLNALRKAKTEQEKTEVTQAALHYRVFQAKGQPWVPADSGFDCFLDQVEAFLKGQALGIEIQNFQNAAKKKAMAG